MNRFLLPAFMSLAILLCLPHARAGGPSVEIVEAKEAPDGIWIFAVKIFASQSEPLSLSRPASPVPAGQERVEGDDEPLPFSLAECVLTDTASLAEYKALPQLPAAPFLAPMETTATLAPGGWTALAVAFPAIPPRPSGKKNVRLALCLTIPSLNIQSLIQRL